MYTVKISDWGKIASQEVTTKKEILDIITSAGPGAMVKVIEDDKTLFVYDNALIYDGEKDSREYNALFSWARL